MKKTESAGGVVLNSKGQILVVSQRGLSWSLPKGHIEPGEDTLAAARREIYEESGLKDLALIKPLGSYERSRIGLRATGDHDHSEMKTLTFFLFRANGESLQPIDPDNPEARWVDVEQVAGMLTHPKDQEFVRQIVKELSASA